MKKTEKCFLDSHWWSKTRGIRFGLLFILLLSACRPVAGGTPESNPSPEQPSTIEMTSYAGALPAGAVARLGRGSLEVVAFSSDDQTIAVGGNVGLYLYAAETLEEMWHIAVASPVTSLAISPDGAWLAAGALNGVVNLIHAQSGQVIQGTSPMTNEQSGVYALTWSDDLDSETGQLLAAGFNDGSVAISRITTAGDNQPASSTAIEVLGFLDRSPGGVTALAFHPNGQILASGDRSGSINLWEVPTLDWFGRLEGHERGDALIELAWSPDGDRLLSGARDRNVILWDMLTLEPLHQIASAAEVLRLGYSPDGQSFMSSYSDGRILSYQATDPYPEVSTQTVGRELAGLSLAPSFHEFAAFTPDGTLSVWPLAAISNSEPIVSLTGHTPPIAAATAQSWSPDGRLLATGLGNLVIVWDTAVWEPRHIFEGHASGVTDLAWSPDGAELASASRDHSVIIWNLDSETLRLHLTEHGQNVTSLAYSPDGQRLATAGSLDDTLLIWDLETGQVLGIYPGEGTGVWSVAWLPDGQTLATGLTSGHVQIWKADNHASSGPLTTMIRHSDWVSGLDFSPDGNLLASVGADGRLLITRLEDEKAKTLSGHLGPVRRVHFSPDGDRLVTSGIDGQVILWDARSEADTDPLIVFNSHTGPINDAGWSPDGRRLVSVSDDGTAIIWDVPTGP